MVAKNDITLDKLQTRVPSQAYKDNWDRIFGKKDKPVDQDGTVRLGDQDNTDSEGGQE